MVLEDLGVELQPSRGGVKAFGISRLGVFCLILSVFQGYIMLSKKADSSSYYLLGCSVYFQVLR